MQRRAAGGCVARGSRAQKSGGCLPAGVLSTGVKWPAHLLRRVAGRHGNMLRLQRLRAQVPECPANYRAWVEEMANYVKRLDPVHLVTIGEEGFFGEEQPEAVHNPQGWGGQIGQNFVLDHMPASIDFATVHVWPDNWQR